MDPGELNRKGTIQQYTTDPVDEELKIWSTFATPWVKKAHQSSREFFAAQKINAETTDLFIARYRSGVTTKMRFVCDGKTYDIMGADDPDGTHRELYLLCREVV